MSGQAGSPSRIVAAARAALASTNLDDLTIDDCRAADLCWNCKHPFHGKTCTAQLRGKKLR